MMLEDLIKTDAYKMADCVEYIDSTGIEVEYKEYFLKATVSDYHMCNGCLTIELNI